MSILGQIFTEAGVGQQKLIQVVNLLRANPMAAMVAVQELKLSDDVMKKIMVTVMMDPHAIEDLAKELGLTEDDISAIKNKFNPN